jgi:hypothetical protein
MKLVTLLPAGGKISDGGGKKSMFGKEKKVKESKGRHSQQSHTIQPSDSKGTAPEQHYTAQLHTMHV